MSKAQENAATVAALLELGLFALKSVRSLQDGEKTPEEIRAAWPDVSARMGGAWDAWDAAGQQDGG